jgi:hypothetical protein
MSIISPTMLLTELPTGASAYTSEVLSACVQASSFVSSYTSKKYELWDDYLVSPETVLVPDIIYRLTIEAGKIFYLLNVNTKQRIKEEKTLLLEQLSTLQTQLENLNLAPTWESQSISLTSDKVMQIYNTKSINIFSNNHTFIKVIPNTAIINSATSNVWVNSDHFIIRLGLITNDEYPQAWYLDSALGYTVEGTLRYMRTYRIDGYDYMKYNETQNLTMYRYNVISRNRE